MTQGAYQPMPDTAGAEVLHAGSPPAPPDDALVELIYGLSHDLRSPLTLVTGVLQTLSRPEFAPRDPDLADLLRSAVDGSKRMRLLLDDFITAAEVLAGQRDLRIRQIDPGAELRLALGADDRAGPCTTVRVAHPVTRVSTDGALLSQIVSGLVHGCIRRGAGRVTVDVAVGTGRLVVVVSSDGPGLPPETARRLTTADSAVGIPGLGLGERMAASLTARLGGRLSAVPVPGGATSLRVVLPVDAPDG